MGEHNVPGYMGNTFGPNGHSPIIFVTIMTSLILTSKSETVLQVWHRGLADWQQGTELDGSVYRVAASIRVNGIQFDPEAFVTRLRAERGA